MITIAFYHGRADRLWHRIQDRAVRFVTKSRYSHCELIAGEADLGEMQTCYSASGRDGAVRVKRMVLEAEKWDLLHVPRGADLPLARIHAVMGAPYDYKGIFLTHVLPLGRHHPDKWFCSEIIAHALGMPDAHQYTPGDLARILAE